ncbi:MAG: hypothetical protein ACREJO_11115, partial [Phycisphaerales bacterium]
RMLTPPASSPPAAFAADAPADAPAPDSIEFDLSAEFAAQDNAAFLARVASELIAMPPSRDHTFGFGRACIGLIGEYKLIGYISRRAQEIIRIDHSPSYWSHAFLFAEDLGRTAELNRDPRRSPWIWESTLEPSIFGDYSVDRNGVGPRRLADYAFAGYNLFTRHCVPNMAVISIGLTEQERDAILARANNPDADQLRYDFAGLIGAWYAYITDRANHKNPLSDGKAIFCSAYVQMAYDAAGIDLSPGSHERNTAPEHIWQYVRHLAVTNNAPALAPAANAPRMLPRPIRTWTVIRDKACLIAPIGVKFPTYVTDITSAADNEFPPPPSDSPGTSPSPQPAPPSPVSPGGATPARPARGRKGSK